jgi:nickel/cobalt transporter (NiCoT) family protein
VPDGHRGRGVHERRVRLGVRQAVRKVFYNITITSISVAVALIIGTIELVGVLADQANITSGPLGWIANINLDYAGYAIVGLFLVSWAIALAVWRFGRIESRWSAHLASD